MDQSEDMKRQVVNSLGRVDNFQYVPTHNERVKYILWILMFQSDFITIDTIASELFVSRSTLIKDLDDVRRWLEAYGLQLKTSTKKGIMVIGSEAEIRSKTIEIMAKKDIEDTRNTFGLSSGQHDLDISLLGQFNKIFDDLDIRKISDCIKKAETMLHISFTDQAFTNIILHVGVAIKRIKLGKQIEIPEATLSSLIETKEFKVAGVIANILGKSLNLEFSKNEIGYIAVHFLGSNLSRISYQNDVYDVEYQILCHNFVTKVSKKINVDLTQDDQLYYGILGHLKPTIFRLKNHLKLENPIKDEIIQQNTSLFRNVKECLKPLEQYTSRIINDDEVAYFVIHIGASIERRKREQNQYKYILIVCGDGVATSEMLSARIRSIFKVKIIDCIPYHQLNHFKNREGIDLIISTIPINNQGVRYCLVSPFLNNEDIRKLSQYIAFNTYEMASDDEVSGIISIIQKHCQIINKEDLITELTDLLAEHNNELERRCQPVLTDLLTDETIKLNVLARNWEDAVSQGGALLISSGSAEQQYIDAMIRSVKSLGPYIVIAPGIAMPHARPGLGTKKVGMSLITLKHSINFGNKANDPVKLVVCLCSTDHSTHLKALSELVTLLKDHASVTKIENAVNVEEITELIKEKVG